MQDEVAMPITTAVRTAARNIANCIADPGFFRLALASVVVVHHFSRFALGHLGVFLFFVLSGYWIHRLWIEKYSKLERPYPTYLLSRLWRLLPVFVLINAVALLVGLKMGDKAWHFWPSNLLIFGYSSLGGETPLTPAWSLDIEFQFYLLAPLLAALLLRPRTTLLVWLVAMGGLVSLAMLPPGTNGCIVFQYLVFFLFGMVASWWKIRVGAQVAIVCLGIACAVIVVFLVVPELRDMLLGGAARRPNFAYNHILNIALAFVLAPVALYTVTQPLSRTGRMAGDLSYIVYLLHWPALVVVSSFAVSLSLMPRLALTLSVLIGVYGLALVIWRYFDRPLNDRREQFLSRCRRSPA
jgi:peptidoglycan/LPS O-acetylase OafA/YrhL